MTMSSSAEEDTPAAAALPSDMDTPEDLDVFVKELMDNMVSVLRCGRSKKEKHQRWELRR